MTSPTPTGAPARRRGLFVAALVLSAAALHAQQSASGSADETVTLSPFEVSTSQDTSYAVQQTMSATRTAADIQDLPISISVITDQFIQDIGAIDIQDALLYENAVSGPPNAFYAANLSSTYRIRGFTAATMHDGFLSAGSNTPIATIAVDRVEVVKGPESLLYGEMEPGGLVNIVSKQPSPTQSATLTMTTGSYGEFGGSADMTGPLTKDGKFTYRIMADEYKSDAITEFTSSTRKEFVGMLGGQLTPTTDLKLEFDYVGNRINDPAEEAFYTRLLAGTPQGNIDEYLVPGEDGTPPDWWNYRGPGDYGDGSEHYLNAVLRQRLGSRWNARLAYASLWDYTSSITRKTAATFPDAKANLVDTYNNGRSLTQTLDFDLTSSWNILGADWKLLLGATADTGITSTFSTESTVTYSNINVAEPSTWPIPWPPPAPPLSTFTDLQTNGGLVYHEGAAYTSNTVSMFGDHLHLLLGARINRVNSTASDFTTNPASIIGYSENDTVYETGIMYDVIKSFGLYANWSQSFEPQNTLLINPKPTEPGTNQPIPGSVNTTSPAAPLTGEGHDLGFKTTLVKAKLYFNGDYYDVRESNEIQTREITNGNGQVVDDYDVQSGAEWSQGMEFNLVGNPAPGLDAMVNYTQPFSGILLSDAATPAYAGKELQQNPKHQLGAFLKYTFQDTSLKGFFVGAGVRYWSDFQANNPTTTELATLPGYCLVQAVLGYTWKQDAGRYTLQLNGNNVTDQHRLISPYAYSGSTTWQATLTAKF